jgi:hypothetical protein
MPGRFANIPLMPSVAREIIRELFSEQSIWKKSAIDNRVDQVHRSEGGLPGKQPLSGAVKKALQDLQAEGFIVTRYGHWQLRESVESGNGGVVEVDALDESGVMALDQEVAPEFDIVVEKEIGSGPESVYLFFNPNDQKLAVLGVAPAGSARLVKRAHWSH